jgi:hypothetical protein
MPQEEEDAHPEVVEVAEAPGRCFDFLDSAVEAFGHGVGDPVLQVVEHSFEVGLESFDRTADLYQTLKNRLTSSRSRLFQKSQKLIR